MLGLKPTSASKRSGDAAREASAAAPKDSPRFGAGVPTPRGGATPPHDGRGPLCSIPADVLEPNRSHRRRTSSGAFRCECGSLKTNDRGGPRDGESGRSPPRLVTVAVVARPRREFSDSAAPASSENTSILANRPTRSPGRRCGRAPALSRSRDHRRGSDPRPSP